MLEIIAGIEPLLLIIIFLLGLIVGSFLNVVVIRGHKGESIGGRSHCVGCNAALSVRELIPVVSFVAQKGRCRHCKRKISWQYPLVELSTAFLYVGGFLFLAGQPFPATIQLFFGLGLALGLPAALVIFVSDLRFQAIPDGATLTLGLLGALAVILRARNIAAIAPIPAAVEESHGMLVHTVSTPALDIAAALVLAAILGGLWFFSKGQWMGFGDVKLILATSLILGFPASIAAFLFAFWSGGIAGALLLLTGKKRMRQQMPFGPFILLGGVLAYFFSSPFFNQAGFGILL